MLWIYNLKPYCGDSAIQMQKYAINVVRVQRYLQRMLYSVYFAERLFERAHNTAGSTCAVQRRTQDQHATFTQAQNNCLLFICGLLVKQELR